MIEEIWQDIPGIHTHQVSNMGNLRSKDRLSTIRDAKRLGTYTREIKGKNLKLNKLHKNNQQGYVFVSINDKTYTLHRLVAKTFLSEQYFDGANINHKDGNKHNNRVENLEWVTASENELHAYKRLGKNPWNKGKSYKNPKAIQKKKQNYLEACNALLKLKNLSKATDKTLADFLNMSRRQLNHNLQIARRGGGEK